MLRRITPLLLALLSLSGLAMLTAHAAYPVSSGETPADRIAARTWDQLHHLSGVVAIPPGKVRAGQYVKPGISTNPLLPPVFGPNVDATLNNPAIQNETTISIYKQDTQRVMASANDYRASLKPMVYLSTDGGTNWINYQVSGTSNLFYGDPAMAYGSNLNGYFSYLGYTAICNPSGGMYVSRTTDGGASFTAPMQLAANTNNGTIAEFQDKEYVAVDNSPASSNLGNVYVAWTYYFFTPGASCGSASSQIAAPIAISRSTDQGVTWSVPITASQPISNNNSGVVPAVGNHGEVYLYYVGAQTQSQTYYDSILFSRSTDGGQTFPYFTHISDLVDLPSPLPHTQFRDNGFGAMAVDRQIDGYLYAVWADYRNGDADIMFSRSTDNGTTWGARQRVNDDPVGNGKDQFFPWIATGDDGIIHIGWFDRRDDPNDANYKEYYTYSDDHGASFAPNIAVSSAPSVPGSSNFIGDYSGIDAAPGVVMPLWTDMRSGGNENAYTARGSYSPPGTATPTAEATATVTVAPSNTSTATSTSTETATSISTETPTSTSTETATSTATDTATSTSTSVPPSPTASSTPIPPSATPTTCSVAYPDVPPGSTFYQWVHCLACHGIITGFPDGSFRPNASITRGQLSKIVSNAANFNEEHTGQTFVDVPPGSPFYIYIERLASRSIIGGYACGGNGEPCPGVYFRPDSQVTRGQTSKIVAIAANLPALTSGQQTFEDVPEGSTFWTWVEALAGSGAIQGYACGGAGEPCVPPANKPYFRPNTQVTRGQASKIVSTIFFPGCQALSK